MTGNTCEIGLVPFISKSNCANYYFNLNIELKTSTISIEYSLKTVHCQTLVKRGLLLFSTIVSIYITNICMYQLDRDNR